MRVLVGLADEPSFDIVLQIDGLSTNLTNELAENMMYQLAGIYRMTLVPLASFEAKPKEP